MTKGRILRISRVKDKFGNVVAYWYGAKPTLWFRYRSYKPKTGPLVKLRLSP